MMTPTRIQKLCLVGLMIALQLGIAVAAAADDRRGRRGPPEQAIDACSEAQEGDACSFVGRRDDSLTGTCEVIHERFVCVPEGHRSRNRGEGRGDREEREAPADDESTL
jgi:hypothetical protein